MMLLLLKVAPDTASTSTAWEVMISSMTVDQARQKNWSSSCFEVSVMSVISPFWTVTSTTVSPRKPIPLPVYVPSAYCPAVMLLDALSSELDAAASSLVSVSISVESLTVDAVAVCPERASATASMISTLL